MSRRLSHLAFSADPIPLQWFIAVGILGYVILSEVGAVR